MSTMEFEVSGKVFKVDKELLTAKPDTRLGKMAKTPNYTVSRFDRPLSSFEAILSFYQTGELHMPNTVCPRAFKLELDFWELKPEMLESCCYIKYLSCLNDDESAKSFYVTLMKKNTINTSKASTIRLIRNKIWTVLDYREPSKLAKAYRCIELGFVLLSLVSLCIGTMDEIKKSLNICNPTIHEKVVEKFAKNFQIKDCLHHYTFKSNCSIFTDGVKDDILTCATGNGISETDAALELALIASLSDHPPALIVCDKIVIAFFTVELVLRLLTCPSIKHYIMSVLNMLEVIILLLAYIQIIVTAIHEEYKYDDKGVLQIIYYAQVFRVFRLISVLKNVMAMRVLRETLKRSYKDILVMVMYIIVSVIIFGCFFFFAEDDMSNIFDSFWWAIVTLTTVGYGDIVPKTAVGKVIGSLCSVAGIIVIALIIPVFVNTFINLYELAQLADKMPDEEEIEAGETGSGECVTKEKYLVKTAGSAINVCVDSNTNL